MRILITCGPAWEPLDGARRLTNMSTGRLGVTLANALTAEGHEVVCLRGEGATCSDPVRARELHPFTTNDDLAARLETLADGPPFGAVLHAAALCDFRVARVRDEQGNTLHSPKFTTRNGRLTLELEPATKILPLLRGWFPYALIVGWKYELAGTRGDALARAARQLREADTDACVLNGAAWGPGYALCTRDGHRHESRDLASLTTLLADWLGHSPGLVAMESPMPPASPTRQITRALRAL